MAAQKAILGRIRGKLVDMNKVSIWLRQQGISQRDFASKAGIDQSYVSRILNGQRPLDSQGVVCPPDEFVDTLIKLCQTHGVASGAFDPSNNATTGSFRPQGNANVDDIVNEINGDGGGEAESSQELVYFPMAKAQKIATLVRTAAADGDVAMTFSPRKLAKWGGLFKVLHEEYGDKLTGIQVLSAAFWLAAVYPADDEGRRFLLETFQRIFAMEAVNPLEHIPHDPSEHPATPLVRMLAKRGIPVYAFGPTGCGKTHAEKTVARELSKTGHFFRFQGDRDKNVDDFVGSYAAKDGSTYTELGPLPRAMEAGEPLILDEPTVCDPSVLMALQAVLEGDALYITKGGGRRIFPKEGFVVLAADNTRGLGESIEYVGTNPLNEALRDRFTFVEFEYMPAKQERDIVKSIMDRDYPKNVDEKKAVVHDRPQIEEAEDVDV